MLTHLYFYINHRFWYYQPVSLYTSVFLKYGKISNKIPDTVQSGVKYQIKTIDNQAQFYPLQQLLNQNFRLHDNYQYLYNKNYLDWVLNSPIKSVSLQKYSNKKWNIGLFDQDDLIGFIHGKPITINLNNQEIFCFYVDFLCINKKYRGKHLAPVLISNMAKNGFLEEYQVFIFKKEIYPLPFKYINQYSYYLLDVSQYLYKQPDFTNIIPLQENNAHQCYQFYLNKIKNYQLKVDFSFEEFKHYFMGKHIFSFVRYDKSKIIGFISAFDSRFMIEKKKTCLQINCVLGNPNLLFEKIYLHAKKNNFQYIMINNMGKNQDLITKYNFKKISNCFIHFYNFHLYSSIGSQNIFFPIP